MREKDKKTKVLFVITKSNFGGAQKYVFDLATGLPADQFDVAVILGGSGTLTHKLQEKGIRIISIFSLKRDVNLLSDIFSFFKMVSIFVKERPDVVHLNSAKAGGIGALAARFADVPRIIFTAHGWAFNEERSLVERTAIKFFSWFTILLSHTTIAVSEAIKNDAVKWPFISNKVVVVKNGIKQTTFYTRKEALAHLFAYGKTHVPENAFVIGSISELHKNKGLEYAIEAFSKLAEKDSSLYYFILGGGEEEENLSALIGRLRLEERILLLGYIEDASRFLSAFDIFLLPSVKEGLPYVLLEAGLARIPTIATNVGGVSEIIEDKETGILIKPTYPDSICNAVRDLFNSPPLRSTLGSNLKEKVVRDFSFDQFITDTTKIYLNS